MKNNKLEQQFFHINDRMYMDESSKVTNALTYLLAEAYSK